MLVTKQAILNEILNRLQVKVQGAISYRKVQNT